MSDTFTEVTSESWFSRLGGAVKGVLIGMALVLIGIGLLFWNEGRAVKRAKDLEAGAGTLVSVSAATVAPANDGNLVHFSGDAATAEVLTDAEFGVSAPALRLAREVEMYQWIEDSSSTTKKKVGGGTKTETTYTYRKDWSAGLVDSGGFKKIEGHRNPEDMPFQSQTSNASNVTVDAFRLPDTLVRKLHDFRPLDPPQPRANQVVSDRTLHLGGDGRSPDPANPQVGDVRVTWSAVMPGAVSVIGVQQGQSLAAWQGPSGSSVFEIESGTHTGEAMFGQLAASNRNLLWILRAVGVLAIFIGLGMVMAPLGVLADVLPPVGSLVRVGTGLVSFLVGTTISLATISVGWLFYRPLIGIPLALGAVAAIVALFMLMRKKATAASAGGSTAVDEPRMAA